MRKFLSILLAICLVASLCVPAAAAAELNSMGNFAQAQKYDGRFSDLPADYWANDVIALCYEYGLMNGQGENAFAPFGTLTLAEAVVMACRVNQIYATGSCTLTNGEPWYQPYVDYAVSAGIVKAGEFADYTAPASRAQMALIFSRALPDIELLGMNYIGSIPDVKVGDYAGQEIRELYEAGVLTGSDVYGTFNPGSTIIRAEAAAILARIALPEQRRSTFLMREFEFAGGISAALPQDTVQSGNSCYSAIGDFSAILVVTPEEESGEDAPLFGSTVSEIIGSAMLKVISEGSTVGEMSSRLGAFGEIQACRTAGTITSASGTAGSFVFFTWYTGTDLNSLILLDYGLFGCAEKSAAAVTVGGNPFM